MLDSSTDNNAQGNLAATEVSSANDSNLAPPRPKHKATLRPARTLASRKGRKRMVVEDSDDEQLARADRAHRKMVREKARREEAEDDVNELRAAEG